MKIKISNNIKIAALAMICVLVAGIIIAMQYLNYKSNLVSPCNGNPAEKIELGSPYNGGPTAEFTSSGELIYITARYYNHNGIFGSFSGSTAINIGSAATPPAYDEKTGKIANSIKSISVPEGEYGNLSLPAGRYWLWSSSGGDIVAVSCKPGAISDPLPTRISRPTGNAAIICGGNHIPKVTQTIHLSPADHPSAVFGVTGDPELFNMAIRNIENTDDTAVEVHFGNMDKIPDWNDLKNIRENSLFNIRMDKDIYYYGYLSYNKDYWVWSEKEADLELMECVPETSNQ